LTPVLREYAASISRITDMSNDIHEINALVDRDARISCLPDERPYPLIADTALKLGIT